MEGDTAKKLGISIFVVVLLLVGVLVGTVITRNLSTSQNTKTSASQSTVTPIEVLSPAPGQTITSATEVKARIVNSADLKTLNAVFKVGEEIALPMKLQQQGDKLVMTGTLSPVKMAKGRYPLSIYLYQNKNGSAELIGSAVFYVQI